MFCHANHWIKFTGFIISESRIKILASERRYRHVCTTDFLFKNVRNAICIDRADTNEFQCGAHHFAHTLNENGGWKCDRDIYIHKYSVPKIKNNLLALTCDRCHSILWIPNIYMDVYICILPANFRQTHQNFYCYRIIMMPSSNRSWLNRIILQEHQFFKQEAHQ